MEQTLPRASDKNIVQDEKFSVGKEFYPPNKTILNGVGKPGEMFLDNGQVGTADANGEVKYQANTGDVFLKTTITAVRGFIGKLKSNYFKTTDIEGDWYYDASDTVSNDNTGTVLVTADGKRLKRFRGGILYPEWFETKGGGADDTIPFEKIFAAIKDGDIIQVTNWHKITKTITCKANNFTVQGGSGYTRPIIECSVPGTLMFDFQGYGWLLNYMGFRGDGGANGVGATVKFMNAVRGDGTKDIDCKIKNCSIGGFAQAIYAKGTNFEISNSGISSSLEGIRFDRNGTDESRGLVVKNVRFHSCGTIGLPAKCVVVNTDAFSCDISNNFVDSVYSFYEGPINGINIDNNLMYRISGEPINILTATYTTQQRTGSVSYNTIFQNSPSYMGNGITLRMQNGQCVHNKIIGSRYHGINMIGTTGSIVSDNTILSHNYNVATDGAIYDGIYADGASTNNIIESNHVRSTGNIGRSAYNIISASTLIGMNWADSLYVTPYLNQKPTLYPLGAKLGLKKKPTADFDVLGTTFRMQKADVISGVPIEHQGTYTKADGTEIIAAVHKYTLASSADGAEKGNHEFWTMTNGVLSKRVTIAWDGGVKTENSDFANKPLQLGTYVFWINALGFPKYKNGVPLNDNDGKYVGQIEITTAQRDTLTGLYGGLEIYNTTTNTKEFYNGTAWKTVATI